MADATKRTWLAALSAGVVLIASPAAAQLDTDVWEPGDDALLPAPERQPPILAGDVHLEAVFPVADARLCPAGSGCIFGGGGGIGGSVERRWPTGYAIHLGYDAWFLDADGVYEVTVLQMVRAGLRYLFLRESMAHPFVGGSIGGLVIGDTFRVAGVGGAGQLRVGVEVELSETLALTASTVWRAVFTSSFVTSADGLERGNGDGVNLAATLQLGLAILESP